MDPALTLEAAKKAICLSTNSSGRSTEAARRTQTSTPYSTSRDSTMPECGDEKLHPATGIRRNRPEGNVAAAAESDTRGKNAPQKRPNATTAGITALSAVSEQCRRHHPSRIRFPRHGREELMDRPHHNQRYQTTFQIRHWRQLSPRKRGR